MDLSLLLSSAAAALVSGVAFSAWTAQRVRAAEQQRSEEQLARLQQEQRVARGRLETKLVHLQTEVRSLQRMCLVDEVTPPVPVRPEARAVQEIASRLRGLAFLDALVIADPLGLPWGREQSRLETELAAAAPVLVKMVASLEPLGLSLLEASMTLGDTLQIAARPLPSWTGGAWLLGASTGQPPNPLAMAAAMAFAGWRGGAVASPTAAPSLATTHSGRVGERGAHARALLDEMERFGRVCGASSVVLMQGSTVLLGVHQDSLDPGLLSDLFVSLERSRVHLEARLRQPVEHLDLVTSALRLHLAPLGSKLRLQMLGPQLRFDPAELQRFSGKIKRLHADLSATQEAA